MTRHNPVEVPPRNPLDTLIITRAIRRTQKIPTHPLLPDGTSLGRLQTREELREEARGWGDVGFGELFRGGEVEEEVGLDEGLGGAVVEDEFFVGVGVDELRVELGVEFGGDGGWGFVGGEEEEVGGGELKVVLLVAVGGEGVWGEDFGVGVGLRKGVLETLMDGADIGAYFVPALEEDVMFLIRSYQVLDLSQGVGFFLRGLCEGDWGEDGDAAGCESNEGASAADLDAAKA